MKLPSVGKIDVCVCVCVCRQLTNKGLMRSVLSRRSLDDHSVVKGVRSQPLRPQNREFGAVALDEGKPLLQRFRRPVTNLLDFLFARHDVSPLLPADRDNDPFGAYSATRDKARPSPLPG